MTHTPVRWPNGCSFAFTIFDDTDSQPLEVSRPVYQFLEDCGLRTTKSVWVTRGPRHAPTDGATCAEPEYLEWAQSLQRRGFEIGYHMAASHTSRREETVAALDAFARYFGGPPKTMANHYNCDENLYWGEARLSGWRRSAYSLVASLLRQRRFYGHRPNHPYFWGDACRERIKYVRNFVYADINTLKACPFMPYHDPERPYVNYWFASSEGANANSFVERISEKNQDRLEAEGGLCIMYSHFGLGFCSSGVLDDRFRRLITRLSKKRGWFVPVSTVLDYLQGKRGALELNSAQRRQLELAWLLHKIRFGST